MNEFNTGINDFEKILKIKNDISDKETTFHTHNRDEHFCEVELLQMIGAESCKSCEDTK